jgi:hypothetical protein
MKQAIVGKDNEQFLGDDAAENKPVLKAALGVPVKPAQPAFPQKPAPPPVPPQSSRGIAKPISGGAGNSASRAPHP